MTTSTEQLHGETCRRLRAEGMSFYKIGRQVGIEETTVRRIVNENGWAEKRRAASRKSARRPHYFGMPHDIGVASRKARKVTQVVSQEDKMDAVRANARGWISTVEMLRRITPRDKWKPEWVKERNA